MSKMTADPKPRMRQIVGFSLPPELARKVKAEAGRRNVSLRVLFAELWELYEQKRKASRS